MPDTSQTPAPSPPPEALPPQVPPPGSAAEKRALADLVIDVTQGTSSLVREEFELAKAEITEKVGKILRGSVVGIAAGAFAFLALILVMEGVAWFLNEEVFDGKFWPGFFIEAAVFLLIAAGAGYAAYRSVKAGAPPLPEQAIEEAKLTRSMFESEAENLAEGVEKNVVKGGGK
jgi:putative superfamily III holin-X